jgi:hypothetical protein
MSSASALACWLRAPILGPIVDIAAGEAAQMIDARVIALAENRLSRRLQRMNIEQHISDRQRTTRQKAAAQRHFAALHPQCVLQRALCRGVTVGLATETQT